MTSRRGHVIAAPAAAVLVASFCLAAPDFGFPAPGEDPQHERIPVGELVSRADRIVVSEVVEVRTEVRETRDGPLPFSLVTLRVLRTLKGAASMQLLIEVPGGTVAGPGAQAGPAAQAVPGGAVAGPGAVDRPGAAAGPDAERLQKGLAERIEFVGMPSFRVGDRDVLFLAARGSLSPVVGLGDGRFPVAPDPEGGGQENVTFRGEAVRAPGGRPISLAAFEQFVTRMVAGTARSEAQS